MNSQNTGFPVNLKRSALLILLLCHSATSQAEIKKIHLPISLDNTYLQQAVLAQAYTEPDNSARVWDDGSGCNFMVLRNPAFDTLDGRLRLVTDGQVRVGKRFGDSCLVAVDWSGIMETYQEVSVDAATSTLKFTVIDSTLSDEGGLTGTVWDLAKQYMHPRLSAVKIELGHAFTELGEVIGHVFPEEPERVAAILDTLTIESARVVDNGIEVQLAFAVDTTTADTNDITTPQPALTEEEMKRYQESTQNFDSFLTNIIKYMAFTISDPAIRRDLLYVLIEARYDILRVLNEPSRTGLVDPVRALFVRTWARLSPILRELGPEESGLRGFELLSFIAAADALHALDSLGPELNLEISANGLRRMARILNPEATDDPLKFDEAVDSDLRDMFEFSAPRPPESNTNESNPGNDTNESRYEPSPPYAPDVASIPQRLSRLTFIPAYAANPIDKSILKRLNSWIPKDDEFEEYLPLVRDVLYQAAEQTLDDSKLEPSRQRMFETLVLATAWQETCWRQYTVVQRRLVPIKSTGGALGIMQVLPSVWRGFYDPNGLAWDISYNAAAGSEILLHYLKDYAIARGEHEEKGGEDNLPMATYAAYNGGPGQLDRYRLKDTPKSLHKIDASFLKKYRAIAKGNDLAVLTCFTG